jgi:hypothetical protein
MVHRPTQAALPAKRLRVLRQGTVTCLLVALCAASFLGAGRRPLASNGAPRQSAPQGVVPDEALQDWPSQLPDAVGIFQCWPGAQRKTHESIVVWTDREDHVIALAPAREEDTLPHRPAARAATGRCWWLTVGTASHLHRTALRCRSARLSCSAP